MRTLALFALAAASLGPAAALSCGSDSSDAPAVNGSSTTANGSGGSGGAAGGSSTSTSGAGGDPSTSSSASSSSTTSSSSTGGGQGGAGGVGGQGGGATSSSSTGGECAVPGDCSSPPLAVCEQHTCIGGFCGAEDVPAGGAWGAQSPTDCVTVVCDGNGALALEPALNETPADDAKPCTDDVCTAQGPAHPPKPAGTPCPSGSCNANGWCVPTVACKLDTGPNQGTTYVCDGVDHWPGVVQITWSGGGCFDGSIAGAACPANTICQVTIGNSVEVGHCQ